METEFNTLTTHAICLLLHVLKAVFFFFFWHNIGRMRKQHREKLTWASLLQNKFEHNGAVFTLNGLYICSPCGDEFEGREVDLMCFFLAATKQFWDPHLKVQTYAMVVGCLTHERVLNWYTAAGKLCSHWLRQKRLRNHNYHSIIKLKEVNLSTLLTWKREKEGEGLHSPCLMLPIQSAFSV